MNLISLLRVAFAAALLTIVTSNPGVAIQDSLQISTDGDAVLAGPSPTIASLEIAPTEVAGGTEATGTIQFDDLGLRRVGVIELSSSDPAVVSVPATVPLTGSVVTFTIGTSPVRTTRTIEITARRYGEQVALLTVRAPLRLVSLRLEPSSVRPGERAKGAIELNGPVLAETRVRLTSSHPTLVQVPEDVVVWRGASMARFLVTVASRLPLAVAATIRAEMDDPAGPQTVEASLTVRP